MQSCDVNEPRKCIVYLDENNLHDWQWVNIYFMVD